MIVWNNGSKSNGNHGYHRGQNNNLSINKDRNSIDSRVDVVIDVDIKDDDNSTSSAPSSSNVNNDTHIDIDPTST